ncbi:MAG: tyrosine--tRNA ligase [Deltaproteobacteria bacterium]|nr:tyrosine--tRNA ligase [Deltaproteobacteria bacterium]
MPTPPEQQLEVIRRGTVDLISEKELLARLQSGRPLTVKVGFDPTAPDLHLGHTVVMRKMRQFQDLGHTVVFLVGDFTGRIGDPTGRSKTRPPLSAEEIARNAETYKTQAFKILDPQRTVLRSNSEWLASLDGAALVRLAAQYTVARMLERDDFAKRVREQRPISIHEFLYPLFQAYDSVELRCDVELGGQDQLFNLVVGREVMKGYGLAPQCIVTVPVLEGTDAREEDGRIVGEKMSKSLGNTVALEDPPDEMFGKLMSICDPLMWRYYELLSELDAAAVRALRDDVAQGRAHPRDVKVRLARELVGRFHDPAAAAAAAGRFDKVHRGGEAPDEVPVVSLRSSAPLRLSRAIAQAGLAASGSDAQRLIQSGAVEVDGSRVSDKDASLAPGASYLVKVGKRRFARVTVEKEGP